MRRILASFLLLISSAPAGAQIADVRPGDLPPITPEYRQQVVRWATRFYRDPRVLGDASVSEPVLTRDGNGRLLWLVCVEASAMGPDGGRMPPQRQAIGFAPRYMTAPLARNGASLDRTACADRRLAWQRLSEVRPERRRR